MGSSGKDINKIDAFLEQLPEQERMVVKRDIAFRLMQAGGVNGEERAQWVVDSYPESEMRTLSIPLKIWMMEDSKAANNWIEQQPPGRKKEILRKWYNEGNSFYVEM